MMDELDDILKITPFQKAMLEEIRKYGTVPPAIDLRRNAGYGQYLKAVSELRAFYRNDLFHYETHFWSTGRRSPVLATQTLRYSLN